MPALRSLPDYPNLRYLKVEAEERMRSGEFAALHEAQLAPIPVRHASVDTATQRPTALQGDTRRDTEETPR